MAHESRFLELVNDAKKRIKECDTSEVAQLQAADTPFHLVDVREESEWAAGHLPGAIHLGKGVIERDIEKQVPELDAKIVLYCGGGYRSALAAENLQRMGYTDVLSMDGGFGAWKKEDRSVVTN